MPVRSRSARCLYAIVVFALLGLPRPAAAAGEAYDLTLEGALPRSASPGDATYLVLHVARSGDRWGDVRGYSMTYNKGIHLGWVESASERDGELRMDLLVAVGDDLWVKGGRGVYSLRLRRQADGRLEGDYTGTYRLLAAAGKVTGVPVPPSPAVATLEPVAAGEHPRMLLRRAELPALKAKLDTPFGQAFAARARASGNLIPLGVLYQATGDRALAEQGLALLRAFGGVIDANAGLSGDVGHRLVEVAMGLDLFWDGWPEAERADLMQRIRGLLPRRQRHLCINHANYRPASNYYGPGYGSAALASLLLWGEHGPEPEAPAAPYAVTNASAVVTAPADFKPPAGVPVSAFASDRMPDEWLFAGGFTVAGDEDPLAAFGGPGDARPVPGTSVTHGGRTEVFRLLPHEQDKGYWSIDGRTVIDIVNATGRRYYTTSYFYTVVSNDAPRWVRVALDYGAATLYAAGVPLRNGEVARLEPGMYPVMVVAPIGETDPWGRIWTTPRFVELDAAEAKAAIERWTREHAERVRFWKAAVADWKASGGLDPEASRFVATGLEQMFLHYRYGMGDGGFQAEVSHYGNIAAWYPLVYADAYRHTAAVDASPYPDVTHLMARRLMQASFRGPGQEPVVLQLNTKTSVEPAWCAATFGLTPAAYKPAVLWAWNRVCGVTNEASVARVLTGNGLQLAQAFLNYPVATADGPAAVQAAPPAEVMPLTWQAPTFGFYAFRSGWDGLDPFVAQVFLKARPVGGWNHPNAGTFRLFGLGHAWTRDPSDRNGYRPEESVVLLPEWDDNEGGCGRLVDLQTRPDGSGVLLADLGDVYGTLRTWTEQRDGKDVIRRGALYDGNDRRDPSALDPAGATGLRAVAFDYSGRSGAPCLMALADRISGGKTKQWLWQLPKGGAYTVAVTGNTFTVAYPDASMHATFVRPAGIKLEFCENQAMTFIGKGGSTAGKPLVRQMNAISATVDAREADFLMVATFQRGAAPEVRTRRFSSRVTVGDQTVDWDGRVLRVGDGR